MRILYSIITIICLKSVSITSTDDFIPFYSWKSIRIKAEFHQTDLNDEEKKILEHVWSLAIQRTSEALKVPRVPRRLLLPRSNLSCERAWIIGLNKNRCASVKKLPFNQLEKCLDDFNIPSEHLEGLYEWPYQNSSISKTIIKDGDGIKDYDYILYIQSIVTERCQKDKRHLLAYAKYCKRDHWGRPIAGYVNICPNFFTSDSFSIGKAKMIALHELFHALGFTKDLFHDYQSCDLQGKCTKHVNPVKDIYYAKRLVTPKVVEMTREHFNCTKKSVLNDFGPMLQKDSNGDITSHWDSSLMYSSIMTSTVGDERVTILDKITLAAFEDSGWYGVNYDTADTFLWGKNLGCNFSLPINRCKYNDEYPKFFCKSNDIIGCHYLQRDRGVCQSDDYLGCNKLRCDRDLLNGRCFIANITIKSNFMIREKPSGRCYDISCMKNGTLQVKLGNEWINCPYSETLKLQDWEGILICPSITSQVCRDIHKQMTSYAMTTTHSFTQDDIGGPIEISIIFSGITVQQLNLNSLLEMTPNVIAIKLSRELNIKEERLTKRLLTDSNLSNSIIFKFILLPKIRDGITANEAYNILDNLIKGGKLIVKIGSFTLKGESISKRKAPTDNSIKIDSLASTAAIIGVAIACILVAAIIAFMVFVIQRRYVIMHIITRPRRLARLNNQNRREGGETSV
ncbi:DgyrCDS9869 [Dimorphilus gyrociliatus]|uniref:Leishmanolysin-like peptidase n=1 Tax=Dimorphilus gyrociliatus TaxID=2664684 RepID=A0A7I8VYD2_9ANNE|nr:DgyrCDS9869 [Dimorphilus gyrociliatus]